MHYRGSTTKLNQFTTYDVFWDLVSLEVFDVLVLTVYDFCQLPSFDQLLIHVHLYLLMKRLRMLFNIGTDNTSNNGAPGKKYKTALTTGITAQLLQTSIKPFLPLYKFLV